MSTRVGLQPATFNLQVRSSSNGAILEVDMDYLNGPVDITIITKVVSTEKG